MNMQSTPTVADYAAIKTAQAAIWASGDYSPVGCTHQIVGEHLAETMDLVPGSRVLDVAAGNGAASLAFARRWHAVTATDFVDAMLCSGRDRARAEGLDIDFQIADAEALPFADACFDAVVSTFGVMFAPNQDRAACELLRVCRPGGSIGLTNWTPEGFFGQLSDLVACHNDRPAAVQSPSLWGTRAWLSQKCMMRVSAFQMGVRNFHLRYRSPAHFVEVYRRCYGPVRSAFSALDEAGQQRLHADILVLTDRFNDATDGSLSIQAEYAEVIMIR